MSDFQFITPFWVQSFCDLNDSRCLFEAVDLFIDLHKQTDLSGGLLAGGRRLKYGMIGVSINEDPLFIVVLANGYIVQVAVDGSGVGESNLKVGS